MFVTPDLVVPTEQTLHGASGLTPACRVREEYSPQKRKEKNREGESEISI